MPSRISHRCVSLPAWKYSRDIGRQGESLLLCAGGETDTKGESGGVPRQLSSPKYEHPDGGASPATQGNPVSRGPASISVRGLSHTASTVYHHKHHCLTSKHRSFNKQPFLAGPPILSFRSMSFRCNIDEISLRLR